MGGELSENFSRCTLRLLPRLPLKASTSKGVNLMIKKALFVGFLLAAPLIASAQTSTTVPSSPRGTQPSGQTPAQPRATPVVPHTSLKVGQAAPDFTLPSTIAGPDGRGVRYKLSDFKGKKNVVLAFYVL